MNIQYYNKDKKIVFSITTGCTNLNKKPIIKCI